MFWSPSWSSPESTVVDGPDEKTHQPDLTQSPLRRRRPPPIAASENIEQDEVFLFPSTPSPSSSVTSVSFFSDASARDTSPLALSSSPSPKTSIEDIKPKLFPRNSRLRRRKSTHVRVKDFVPPDVSGLNKQEARVIKNRAAAFLSRQRRREEYEHLEQRVAELEEENARLRDALADLATRSSSESDRSQAGPSHFQSSRAPAMPMNIALHVPELMDVAGYLTPSPIAASYASINPDAQIRVAKAIHSAASPTAIFSPEDQFLPPSNDVNGISFDQIFSDDGFRFRTSLSGMF